MKIVQKLQSVHNTSVLCTGTVGNIRMGGLVFANDLRRASVMRYCSSRVSWFFSKWATTLPLSPSFQHTQLDALISQKFVSLLLLPTTLTLVNSETVPWQCIRVNYPVFVPFIECCLECHVLVSLIVRESQVTVLAQPEKPPTFHVYCEARIQFRLSWSWIV